MSTEEKEFKERHCKPCKGGVKPMEEKEIREKLKSIDGWEYTNGALTKTFKFKDYYKTMAFVNAIAWLAHREEHHPMMVVEYKTCHVRYFTHAIQGISENDFICAAKVNALVTA